MRSFSISVAVTVVALAALPSGAQEHPMHHPESHGAITAADTRTPVAFPAPMRVHFLGKMRNHLSAISDAMTALSAGVYERAAGIADTHLGMESPGAAACRDTGATSPASSPVPDMEQMMSQSMPASMRAAGLAMHQAASQFSAEARAAARSHNTSKAFAALSRVTRQCVACHDAFRLDP